MERDDPIVLMRYLDGDLDEGARRELEARIAREPELASELERFRRLHDALGAMRFDEPTDLEWREFWQGFYNRAERVSGWGLVIVGAVLVAGYALYRLLFDPGIDAVLKTGILALALGFVVLFLSILRGWLRVRGLDRYRRIRR